MEKSKIKTTHAFTNDVLSDLDGVAIAELIKSKKIQPKEAVAAAIERAKKVNPEINSIIIDCHDKALREADQHTKGFFAGVPMYVKDMTKIIGMPTYFGSEALKNAKPDKINDPIANQILDLGFVVLGKSTMPEFGLMASTEFPKHYQEDTHNPWNTEHTAGGSSGGAAALVAAGVIPIAHSSDGGGSTRIPASCCGAVGLKPTEDRILHGTLSVKSIIKITMDGVITRSVRDTAFFYAEAEKYYYNKKLPKLGLVTQPNKRRLKIGFFTDSLNGKKASNLNKQELEKTVKLLEGLGHQVKQIPIFIPEQFTTDFIGTWTMGAFILHKFGKYAINPAFDSSLLTDYTKGLSKQFNLLTLPGLMKRMKNYRVDYKKQLETLDIDLLLTPTLATPAPKLGVLGMDNSNIGSFEALQNWAIFSPYANATGAPSISLPLGFDEQNNLPIGMLFTGKFGDDKTLLELAYELEEAAPWRKITT
jgi:amidase